MKKIHLVTSGCYSGYSVVAAFTAKAKAEAWIESQRYDPDLLWPIENEMYGYRVESFALNPTEDNPYRPSGYWRVDMWEDGDTQHCAPVVVQSGDPEPHPIHHIENVKRYDHGKPSPMLRMMAIVRARDQEHAIKVANELRTLLRASDSWVASPETTP